MIPFTKTDRGFTRGEFKDTYGCECSIQQSSIATADCLWLGCDEILRAPGFDPINSRMHLTREMAAELIPPLQHFVETGALEPSPKKRHIGTMRSA